MKQEGSEQRRDAGVHRHLELREPFHAALWVAAWRRAGPPFMYSPTSNNVSLSSKVACRRDSSLPTPAHSPAPRPRAADDGVGRRRRPSRPNHGPTLCIIFSHRPAGFPQVAINAHRSRDAVGLDYADPIHVVRRVHVNGDRAGWASSSCVALERSSRSKPRSERGWPVRQGPGPRA